MGYSPPVYAQLTIFKPLASIDLVGKEIMTFLISVPVPIPIPMALKKFINLCFISKKLIHAK